MMDILYAERGKVRSVGTPLRNQLGLEGSSSQRIFLPNYEESVEGKQGNKDTVLHYAAAVGDTDAIPVLLTAGANIDVQGVNGETPLFNAVGHGQIKVAELLLQAKASTDIPDRLGNTPLHCAAVVGDCNMLRILLKFGADVSRRNNLGLTPHALTRRMFSTVIDRLRRSNTKEEALTMDQVEALHTALRNYGDVIEMVSEAQISSEIEAGVVEYPSGLYKSSIVRTTDDVVGAEVSIKYPSDVGSDGLCKKLYSQVDKFYSLLDSLPQAGFAFGWNVLPADIALCDAYAADVFDDSEAELETLWVEYEATTETSPASIKTIADEIAELIPEYGVVLFDSDPNGIGIVQGYPTSRESEDEHESDVDSEADESEIEEKFNMLLGIDGTQLASDGRDNSRSAVIQRTTLVVQDVSKEVRSVIKKLLNG